MFKIREAILEWNSMHFKKGMDLETSPVTKHAAQFAGRELLFTIGLERNGFKGSPFGIARCSQETGELVWEVQGNVGHRSKYSGNKSRGLPIATSCRSRRFWPALRPWPCHS